MDKLRTQLRKIRKLVSRLNEVQKDTEGEEWDQENIKMLKETVQLILDQTENLLKFMEEETDTMLERLDEFEKKNDFHEARLQQLEDKTMRAIDFIHEQGLYEQFRRYYEKKKQTNLVPFPSGE